MVVREKPANPNVRYVTSDFSGGAWQVVIHLIRLGHRRIGHLCGQRDTASAVCCLEGYKKALLDAGIEPDEALIVGGQLSEESAAQGMRELFDLPQPPTAVFAANDLMAVAAPKVIRDCGLRVPTDIAVVGFGNWYWSGVIGLTTVEENCQEIGRQAALRLFKLLKNPDLPPEGIVLPTRLLVRASCGANPGFAPLATSAHVEADHRAAGLPQRAGPNVTNSGQQTA